MPLDPDSNKTLREYKRVTVRNNGFIISVIKHKAGHKGRANIACTRSLFREAGIYVKYLQNKIKGISTDQGDTVFVSWSGGAMNLSLITRQMRSFWKRTLKIDIGLSRINPTLFRKYTTSTVLEDVPEIKQSTSNLLCHSLRVPESNYAIYYKQKKAVNASNLVKDEQRSTFEYGEKTDAEDSYKY